MKERSFKFPSPPVAEAPHHTEADQEQFVKKTIEQVQRFNEIRKYPANLLSIKRALASHDIHTKFFNRASLFCEILDPRSIHYSIEDAKIPAVIQSHSVYTNHIEVISPKLPFIILIYCANGAEFYEKAQKGGLFL